MLRKTGVQLFDVRFNRGGSWLVRPVRYCSGTETLGIILFEGVNSTNVLLLLIKS
jgi:hypothetical protein